MQSAYGQVTFLQQGAWAGSVGFTSQSSELNCHAGVCHGRGKVILRKSSSLSSTDVVSLRRSANAGNFRLITVMAASLEIEGIWLQGGNFASGPAVHIIHAMEHFYYIGGAQSARLTNTFVTLKNCRVTDNTAAQGGAINLQVASESIEVENFVDHWARGSVHLNLVDTELTGNTGASTGAGGALSISDSSPVEVLYSVNASGTTRIHGNSPVQGCHGATPRWTSEILMNSQLVCRSGTCTSPLVLPPGGLGCYCASNQGSASYYSCEDPGGSGTCANNAVFEYQVGTPSALRNAWACAAVSQRR